MPDIYGSHFEYAGILSSSYGLIIANAETGRMTALYGERKSDTIFSKRSSRRYLINDDYTESALSFDIEIITEDERALSIPERKRIEKWLFQKTEYKRLYFDMADDPNGEMYEYVNGSCKRSYLNCRFTNPRKLEYNGGIVGYIATLESDSDMFWQEAISKKYSVNNDTPISNVSNVKDIRKIGKVVTVNIDTDSGEYIYPELTVHMGSVGGDFVIFNDTDSSVRYTWFTDISPYADVISKGEINYVNGQYYEKFKGQNFLRLLDGENQLVIAGNVEYIILGYSAKRAL